MAAEKDSAEILALRAREKAQIDSHQRIVERIASALGRPRTTYVALAAAAAWMAYNTFASALGGRQLDPPPFFWMDSVAALTSIVLTTTVLTTQMRQARHADLRSQLDLQVNLRAEQKIAKLIALVEELRRDLPNVPDRRDHEAEAMTQAVNPEAVLSVIEETPEDAPGTS
jgi:uncharacterized membrane protein